MYILNFFLTKKWPPIKLWINYKFNHIIIELLSFESLIYKNLFLNHLNNIMYLFKLPNHLRIKSWRDNILGTADVTHIFHLINKNSTLFKLYTYIYPKPWKIKNLRKTDVKSHSRENKGGKIKIPKLIFEEALQRQLQPNWRIIEVRLVAFRIINLGFRDLEITNPYDQIFLFQTNLFNSI